MPQRQNEATPQPTEPAGTRQPLSGQERHDLDAAAKGFDPAASALPDSGEPPAPPQARSDASSNREESGADSGSTRAQRSLEDAEKKGMVPDGSTSAPPLDGQD